MGASWTGGRHSEHRRRRWPWVALAAIGGLAWLGRRELRWALVLAALVAGWVLFGR